MTPPPLAKTYSKNWGNELFPAGDYFKCPFFLWLKQILKAVAMGVVAVSGIVLVRQAQPSHSFFRL